jgi:hypothetical protein
MLWGHNMDFLLRKSGIVRKFTFNAFDTFFAFDVSFIFSKFILFNRLYLARQGNYLVLCRCLSLVRGPSPL